MLSERMTNWLDSLSTEQQDRILTTPMRPYGGWDASGLKGPCLVETALALTGPCRAMDATHVAVTKSEGRFCWSPAHEYEFLAHRYGHVDVNAAIREHIIGVRMQASRIAMAMNEPELVTA